MYINNKVAINSLTKPSYSVYHTRRSNLSLLCYNVSNIPPPPIYNVQIGEVLS